MNYLSKPITGFLLLTRQLFSGRVKTLKTLQKNNFLRTIIAGWGAKKLGGGRLETILVFIIIYYALGTCNSHPEQTVPNHHSGVIVPAQTTSQIPKLRKS
jgi:hypothetical protein